MHPTVYYTPTAKSTMQTLQIPVKNEHHSIGSHHNSFVVSSPRMNYQLHKIDERPSSHNMTSNTNINKNAVTHTQNEVKPFKFQPFVKPIRPHMQTQKSINNSQQTNFTRYGDMKNSYMGPDSREAAYAKQQRQLYNQNFKTVKKMPRISEPNIFSQAQITQGTDKNDDNNQETNFVKKKSDQLANKFSYPNPSTQATGLSYTASSKKLDAQQRMRMRKSSFDPTQNWIKPITKKKMERKFTLNDFQKINELGTGKYGKVFLVKQKQTQFICALKIIQKQMLKEQQITEQFIRQLKIQLFLSHPNIIKMYGYFDDSMNIYIIMEVALGGQLYKLLKRGAAMPEQKVAIIMRQVVSAINQLHSNQIIHRDIKPENIVLNENIVKLCDFGWSVYHGQTLRTTFCGTPLYVSPQILKGNNYDQKIDIWSLGIMMYEMLTGENPFKITQQQQLIKIIKDAVTFPSYSTISAQAKDFVMSCLQKNPQDRVNIRQLINHEFFKKYPQKTVDKKMI